MRAGCALAALAACVAGGCGGSDEDRPERGEDAFSAVERRTVRIRPGSHAAPRYEPVAELHGPGSGVRGFTIAREAIQWRVRWRCPRPDLRIEVDGRALVDGNCRRGGRRRSIGSGPMRLRARGSGAWAVTVEQEVDSALREPPLPAMRERGARVLASGRFYPIERRGRGRARLHRLASGRLALRLEGFSTSNNTDLFVWVSTARRPRNSSQALRAPHRQLRTLKSTLGDQNYLLPRGFDVRRARSVVIWCEPVQIAYTAATLTR